MRRNGPKKTFAGCIMKKLILSAFITAALAAASQAQIAPQLPTNLPNVTTSVVPPAGFDALTASPATLQQFGYPPNPGPSSGAYAGWAKAVSAPQTRVANPVLEMTDLQAGPVQGFKDTTTTNNSKEGATPSATFRTGNSHNWSGWVIFDSLNKPFGGNNPGLGFLFGTWVVPIAQQAFSRNGDNTFDFCVQWVGSTALARPMSCKRAPKPMPFGIRRIPIGQPSTRRGSSGSRLIW
jgi:hypothetical protein